MRYLKSRLFIFLAGLILGFFLHVGAISYMMANSFDYSFKREAGIPLLDEVMPQSSLLVSAVCDHPVCSQLGRPDLEHFQTGAWPLGMGHVGPILEMKPSDIYKIAPDWRCRKRLHGQQEDYDKYQHLVTFQVAEDDPKSKRVTPSTTLWAMDGKDWVILRRPKTNFEFVCPVDRAELFDGFLAKLK